MRIGIDCRTILNPKGGELAGVGHYTFELVKHLISLRFPAEFVLFFDHRMTDTTMFRGPNVVHRHFPFSKYKHLLPFVASHGVVPLVIGKERLDVFHGPANVLPLGYFGTTVLTIHDLAIYRHPAWFPSGQQFSTRVLIPSSIHRAKAVIAVSHSTAKELRSLFRFSSDRLNVIPEGVGKMLILSKDERQRHLGRFGLQHPFVLFVGTLEPRKNLLRLVRAFNRLVDLPDVRTKFPKLDLVLAGAKGWGGDELLSAIRSLQHRFRIKRLGYVSAEEKIALYQSAELFAFPSLWEGFGLPVLEAMAYGTPVLSSNRSALPEVVGNAGILVDPEQEGEIAAGLRRLLLDSALRKKLHAKSYDQVKRFHWEMAARQTFEVYQRVAKSP